MEKRFKLRFSRIFQASFFSCRSRKHSDVVDKAIAAPGKHRSFHLIEKPSVFTTTDTHRPTLASSLPRRKVSEKFSPFLAPPASPVSPLKPAPLCELRDCLSREKNKKKNKKKKKKKKKKKNSGKVKQQSKRNKKMNQAEEKNNEIKNFVGGTWWYSGDDDDDDDTEDETETLFSSRSLTSDSSVSRHYSQSHRREIRRRSERSGVFPLEGKVKDSFAVVKNSTDPYKDFRASMAEMIVEKEIFGGKELEQLLQCFLSLNSRHYHSVILEVYSEIKKALFFSDLGCRS